MDGIAQDLPSEFAEAPATPARIAEDAAFAALVNRHARFLYRVAFGLLRNSEDAEDAVQETFLKLYRTSAWLAIDDEKAFLARAVWRTGLNRLTSASTRAMKNSQDITELQIPTSTPTPEQHALDAGRRTIMRTLIEALPEPLRQPLVLSAVDGMRSHEVAAILGIPEGTVRTRVMRAKSELRQRFLTLSEARP